MPLHSLFLALGFAVAFVVKHVEERRVGLRRAPGYQWVSLGALAGALVGAKVGMLLYVTPSDFWQSLRDGGLLAFDGKTVLGGLAGGWLGVEVTKKLVGLRGSTGDAFAIAIPLGQAIGRLGCWVGGCCYGAPSTGPWAVFQAGAYRHPHQLYEAGCDFLLAALLFTVRKRPMPSGRLFRLSMLGYAVVRIVLEPFRGDSSITIAGLSAPVLFCMLAVVGISWSLWRAPSTLAEQRLPRS